MNDPRKVKGMNKKKYTKRDSSKNQRREKEVIDSAIKESTANPYSWYANFPNFMKDVANLSFSTPVGQPVFINGADYVANAGIMTINFIPTPGYSQGLVSPINRQAIRMYTYIRSIQKAAASYDAADLMIYLFAVDSLYMYWAYLRRVYGVAQLFSPTNKYYPRRLLQAMGVDPNIANNLADFRAYINRFALNIGRFAAPKQFDLFNRHAWMCSGMYLDSKTRNAQTYIFMPAMFYQYDNTVTTGSQLTGVQFGSFTSTPQSRDLVSLQAFGNNLLQAMENDEDTMNISGDLFRAYGDGGLYAVAETPDNYAILPIYEESVMSQIENAVIMGNPCSASGALTMPIISQNPTVNNGAIMFSASFTGGYVQSPAGHYLYNYPAVIENHLMNFHKDEPSPEDVTEATRLMTGSKHGATAGSFVAITPTVMQADVVTSIDVCITSFDNPNGVRFLHANTQTIWVNASNSNHAPIAGAPIAVDLMAIWQQFDWAPMLYEVGISETETEVSAELLFMGADVDVFSAITYQQLENITEATLLSLMENAQPVRQ